MKTNLALVAVLLFLKVLVFQASAEKRLVAVVDEQILSPSAQFDSVKAEFGAGFDAASYEPVFKLASKICPNVRFVSLLYKTEDPDGKEVVASGLLAMPEKGRLRGTIAVSPVCKEKFRAGSSCRYTMECLPAMFGYAVLVPDTIGYGATYQEDIALLMSENVAKVSADLHWAVKEYLATREKPMELPEETIFFGYSLGAAGALSTACYFHSHPEMNIRLKALYLGSGAYDPYVSLNSALEKGRSGYMVYPGIVRSLNRWMDLDLDIRNLFQGRVLEDYEYISGGEVNLTALVDVYGKDLHAYVHPDVFTEEKNEDTHRLMEAIKKLRVPREGYSLPRSLKIYLRHSAEDDYVPVACSDTLYNLLRRDGYRNVKYYRDKHGSHYDQAALSLLNLFMIIL